MELNVDDEWESFLNTSSYPEDRSYVNNQSYDDANNESPDIGSTSAHSRNLRLDACPEASDIYISTKTNIAYMNKNVDLKSVFWNIPIMKYATPSVGVVKKQMKFNSVTQREVDDIAHQLEREDCIDQNIITSINNPDARVKFKDIRKVSIGVCKKDIVSYRCKKKSAFYNCFVMILRMKGSNNTFKEYHVKVFNTGKLEIPGIQCDKSFEEILVTTMNILRPLVAPDLCIEPSKTHTVLINSNFNCGFYINREELFDIMRMKYNIECIYDPCTYPGIQCKFYYDNSVPPAQQTGVCITQNGENSSGNGGDTAYLKYTPVSFMIFRTGSVLIVGKCQEEILHHVYAFLKTLLMEEFVKIAISVINKDSDADVARNEKKTSSKESSSNKKPRKRVVHVTSASATS